MLSSIEVDLSGKRESGPGRCQARFSGGTMQAGRIQSGFAPPPRILHAHFCSQRGLVACFADCSADTLPLRFWHCAYPLTDRCINALMLPKGKPANLIGLSPRRDGYHGIHRKPWLTPFAST